MTRGQTVELNEKVAVLQERLDNFMRRHEENGKKFDEMVSLLHELRDAQKEDGVDRKELRTLIEEMQPSARTVEKLEGLSKLGLWAVGVLGGIGVTITVMKDWVVLNWNWIVAR